MFSRCCCMKQYCFDITRYLYCITSVYLTNPLSFSHSHTPRFSPNIKKKFSKFQMIRPTHNNSALFFCFSSLPTSLSPFNPLYFHRRVHHPSFLKSPIRMTSTSTSTTVSSNAFPSPSVRSALIHLRSILPPLDGSLHKGQSGRILIMGGTPEYTGAPYFAAISSLRLGADLVYLCTTDTSAAAAIKPFAPDLIVYPSLKDAYKIFPRAHALVIGPGLGRSSDTANHIKCVLTAVLSQDMHPPPIVLDADALYFVANDHELRDLIFGPRAKNTIVLTPNVIELQRILDALNLHSCHSLMALAQTRNVVILVKGPKDQVFSARSKNTINNNNIMEDIHSHITCIDIANDAALKRCGGQGDILAGIVATSLAWSVLHNKKNETQDNNNISGATTQRYDPDTMAVVAAAALTRECSRRAFKKHGRAMLASDILPFIGEVMQDFEHGNLIDTLCGTEKE